MATVGLNLLTHSRTTCFKNCRRRHYFQYELGVRRDRSSAPLRIGSAVHEGLDVRAQGKTVEESVEAAAALYDDVPAWVKTDEDVYDWQVEREKSLRMLAAYFWYWGDDPVEYLATEQSFALPLINPATGGGSTRFRLAGQIDKVGKLPDGRLAVVEHKTTSDAIHDDADDYWRRLRIDQQISLYFIAARDLGFDVQTVLYDVIKKPAIKPSRIPVLDDDGLKIVEDQAGERVFLKNGKPRQSASKADGFYLVTRRETPEEYGERLTDDITSRPEFYFQRREIPRLESDLEDFRAELWEMQKSIGDARRYGRHFRNTSVCFKPYPCEYFQLCFEGIDPTERLPDGFVFVDDVNPELQERPGQ